METRTELKQFLINKQCDHCKTGTMRSVKGVTLTTNPIQYAHKCDNEECGADVLYPKEYPYIVTETVAPKQPKAKSIAKQSNLVNK